MLDLLVDRRRQQRQRLDARLLGRERGVGRVRGEHGVHLARRGAELGHAREHAERIVERELPAVARLGDELLHDPERRLHELAGVLVPAGQLRDGAEAPRREEAQHLELGIDARLDAAKDLQHLLLAEDDRRVGLLGAHRADVAGRLQAAVERDALDLRLVAEQPRQHAHAVVVLAEEQLVELVRAGLEAGLDELELERRVGAQRHVLEDVDGGELARLGRKPALADDPVLERAVDAVGQTHREDPPSDDPLTVVEQRRGRREILGRGSRCHCSSSRRNQKNPRGASVNR